MKNKIKSKTDVVTNSSDECYLVKTKLSASEAKKKFYDHMNTHHSDEWNEEWKKWFDSRHTYEPDAVFDSETGEGVVFDWGSMCNLTNAYGYLKECFPESEITDSMESWIFKGLPVSPEEIINEVQGKK